MTESSIQLKELLQMEEYIFCEANNWAPYGNKKDKHDFFFKPELDFVLNGWLLFAVTFHQNDIFFSFVYIPSGLVIIYAFNVHLILRISS